MAITYTSQAGTIITSYVVNETIPSDQSQQVGNNQVVVSDDFATLSNGQHGDGTNGIGASYVGRLVIKNLAGTQQLRKCTAEAAGTGNTYILTVGEDWDTNPTTGDTIHVFYEIADIEDGGESGGIDFAVRTGFFELTNLLTIGNGTDPAGLQLVGGTALEGHDRGAPTSEPSIIVKNNGRFDCGYVLGGEPVEGGIITGYNNADNEQWLEWQSGAVGSINDTLLWAQLNQLQFEHLNGAGVTFRKVKVLNASYEALLYDATLQDFAIYGKGGTTEIVRVDSGTVANGLLLSGVDTLDTVADTTTETITLTGVNFLTVTDYITLRNNKTFNLIDAINMPSLYSDFNDAAVTGTAAINQQRGVDVIIQTAGGTLLQDAVVLVYEGTQLQDLVFEDTSDVDGISEGAFTHRAHSWTTGSGSTTVNGTFAFRVDKWLYVPFFATQAADEARKGSIILIPDPNIVQATQATAITAGSGIAWNEDSNPSELFEFSSGSGTLLDGMILTFSPSGAVGTITSAMSGDSTAGEIHLKDRNGTAIANGDTFSRTGGTAGSFSGTYVNDSKQPFSIWIDGNDLSYQTIYDFLAAVSADAASVPFTALSIPELLHEWANRNQARALYLGTGGFYTERSGTKGVIIVDGAAGTVDYFTDDAGNTWTPPATTSVTFDKMKDYSEIWVFEAGTYNQIPGGHVEDATNGTEDDRNWTWSYSAGAFVDYKIHCHQDGDETYKLIEVYNFEVPTEDTTIDIQQQRNLNMEP